MTDPVKAATLRILARRDKYKLMDIKPMKLDPPERFFKAMAQANNLGIEKIAHMRFR